MNAATCPCAITGITTPVCRPAASATSSLFHSVMRDKSETQLATPDRYARPIMWLGDGTIGMPLLASMNSRKRSGSRVNHSERGGKLRFSE